MWHLFWIIPVFGGSISAGLKALSDANERRAERAQERYRLKHEVRLAEVQAKTGAVERAQAREHEVRQLLTQHQEVIDSWTAYELDPVRLLEYPVMSDVREPLVAEFHRAMLAADSLRPTRSADPMTRDEVGEYRAAVHHLSTAFAAAESEALRRGWTDFDDAERGRIGRAQKLFGVAADPGATPAERQQALARGRDEISGLIVLPRRTSAAIERKAAAQLER